MFQLRDEHMHAFERRAVQSFDDRALKTVRIEHSAQVSAQSDSEILADIADLRARAGGHGFRTEQQVICFIHASYFARSKFNADGAEPKWAAPILSSSVPETQKAAWLLEFAVAQARSGGQTFQGAER